MQPGGRATKKKVAISLIVLLISLLVVIAGIWLSNLPKSSRYAVGKIKGSVSLLLNSRVGFATYSSDGHRKREGNVHIYLMRFFTINVEPGESKISIYLRQFNYPKNLSQDRAVAIAPLENMFNLSSAGRTDLGTFYEGATILLLRPAANSKVELSTADFRWQKDSFADLYIIRIDPLSGEGGHLKIYCSGQVDSLDMARALRSPEPPQDLHNQPHGEWVYHFHRGVMRTGSYEVSVAAYKWIAGQLIQLTLLPQHPTRIEVLK